MPGNLILSAPRHRVLFYPALHPEPARRHPVVGVVLDQRRRQPGARLHRSADRSHVHDPVDCRQRISAASQLRQSHRRLDVCLPCIRLRGVGRVRDGKRVRAAQTGAAEAAAGVASCAAGNVEHNGDSGDHGSTVTGRVDEGSTTSE